MLKNLNVKKALKRRFVPFQIERAAPTLDRATGRNVHVLLPLEDAKGCFQQLNRNNSSYADDLLLLEEGERTEASTVLWTQADIKAAEQDVQSVSDKVIETRTGRRYKVLLVREKFYGDFNRAILAKVRNA